VVVNKYRITNRNEFLGLPPAGVGKIAGQIEKAEYIS